MYLCPLLRRPPTSGSPNTQAFHDALTNRPSCLLSSMAVPAHQFGVACLGRASMSQQVVDSDRPRQEQREQQDALRVLVVENETQAADTLVQELRRHGHLARSVPTAALALQAHQSVDLVLLDL